jgi:hypothetical protein
LRVNLL